jgi:biopolymer transport protein ExbD
MSMSVGNPDGGGDDSVMVDMNTTPLIDVMLVLLIMLILNIPMQTHASKLDNPPPQPETVEPPKEVVKHEVGVTFENQITYDGAPIELSALAANFRRINAMPKDQQPEVHLRPDKYSKYELTAKIVAAAQISGVTKMGFVGNEAYIN